MKGYDLAGYIMSILSLIILGLTEVYSSEFLMGLIGLLLSQILFQQQEIKDIKKRLVIY